MARDRHTALTTPDTPVPDQHNPGYRLDAGGLRLSHGRYSDFQHCVDPPGVNTEQMVLTLSKA